MNVYYAFNEYTTNKQTNKKSKKTNTNNKLLKQVKIKRILNKNKNR